MEKELSFIPEKHKKIETTEVKSDPLETTANESSIPDAQELELEKQRHVEEIKQRLLKKMPDKDTGVEPTGSQTEEIAQDDGRKLIVVYKPRAELYPAFGSASGEVAEVREDLSPKVRKFVKSHELYHLTDKAKWGGWLGREIRANVVCGAKDPVGLLATTKASLARDRLKYYWQRFTKGF